MIGISKLYCGSVEPSDPLRYGRNPKKLPSHLLQFADNRKPVVVWNVTRRCNLNCVHCYSHSHGSVVSDDLSTEEAKSMIKDLALFGSPVILFSGGEPLIREDILDLIEYARKSGLRAVISTNGTLITKELALSLKDMGLSYVGISLDGLEDTHDQFRKSRGSFCRALEGLKNCQEANIKVGLRFTINRRNAHEIPGIFTLLEELEIPRVCFYHLVYTGRGSEMVEEDLSKEQTRKTVDLIIDLTRDLFTRGLKKEVLTVDNHTDGVYIYLRLLDENPDRAAKVLTLLRMNGGNSSGDGIGCISWDGTVYADQFWRNHPFGNVRERPFSRIWVDPSLSLLQKLKNKKRYVGGRCGNCAYLDICGGNFRARAEAIYGDIWAQEPACYLTDSEIGI
jgi:12,18-didecarboxysiroheme deacetylase